MRATGARTPGPGTHEFEGLVDRITDQILSELSDRAVSLPPGVDPQGSALPPAELLLEHPDRIGCLPFLDESRPSPAADEAKLAARIAGIVDHTLLKPDATPREVERLCEEAHRYRFKSVCVNAGHAALASRMLQGTGVLVCTVVGFPLGATLSDVKAYETRRAREEGASEIDMVLSIGMLRAGLQAHVAHDILEVVRAAECTVKVILETCLLDDDEKRLACRLARESGASFVKTSTGFSTGGATIADIRLMRGEVGRDLGVAGERGDRTGGVVDDRRASSCGP